jgi:hypothetical protein
VVGVNFLESYDRNHYLRAVSRDRRHVVITVPRATFLHTRDDPVSITPDGARPWSDSAVQFRYDPPATSTRPSSTTSTTTKATGTTSTTSPSPSSS